MKKSFAITSALFIFAISTAVQAATLKAQVGGWGYEQVDQGSFMAYMLGRDTKAVLVKVPANGETKTPAIRVMDVQGDASKLNNDVQSWRSVVFVDMVNKPVILNEKILTIGGQQRYFVEFQTDTHTESMLQTTVMAFVMNGKIYKLLYENRQAIYRLDIADVRKAFETVKLTVE